MKAMVLCAGYGTRLAQLTREIPKPMLQLNGKPMLWYILMHLKHHGFSDVTINLHFRPELIRDFFGDGSRWGLSLTYSEEPELLGTAGGLKKVQKFFEGENTFLVQYGDIVTDQDLSTMLRFHLERDRLATLLVHQRRGSNSVLEIDSEYRIRAFLERPSEAVRQTVQSHWANSGICIASQQLFDWIPEGVACDLPQHVYSKAIQTDQLYGFPLSGYRCAIDSPERFHEAATAISEGRCKVTGPPICDSGQRT
jgi:mannose-1-phosphate guanylyltransferase